MPRLPGMLGICLSAGLLISVLCFMLWSWRWPLVKCIANTLHRLPHRTGASAISRSGRYEHAWNLPDRDGGDEVFWRWRSGLEDVRLYAAGMCRGGVPGGDAAGGMDGGDIANFGPVCVGAWARWNRQAGQRDLSMAVLLIGATAALFLAVRQRSSAAMFVFGLLAGVATTIKPTALPLSVTTPTGGALFVLKCAGAGCQRRERDPLRCDTRRQWRWLGWRLGPWQLWDFCCASGQSGHFGRQSTRLCAYYAGLGHKPLGCHWCIITSPFMALIVAWVAVLLLTRPQLDWERGLLLAGVVFGLSSYILQARGFPYHRYPEMVFLLPLMAIDFIEALAMLHRANGTCTRNMQVAGGLAAAAIAFAGCSWRAVGIADPSLSLVGDRFQLYAGDQPGPPRRRSAVGPDSVHRLGLGLRDHAVWNETGLCDRPARGLSDLRKADVPVVAETRKTLATRSLGIHQR